MTDLPSLEEFPVFLRVVEEPLRNTKKRKQSDLGRPNDHLTLVFDCETTTDTEQELRFGIAQVYADGRLARRILFRGKLTPKELEMAQRWAEIHEAKVMSKEEFVLGEFLPLAQDRRAVVVGFNLPFDLARLAVEWEPKRKIHHTRGWKLNLISPSHPKWPIVPKIRVERVSSTLSFISFTGTKDKLRRFPGAFVDLRTFTHALTGNKHNLGSAGVALGCVRTKSKEQHGRTLTDQYINYCLNDVELTGELYFRSLKRYEAFGLETHPSRVYSSASMAKALWEARGVVPPRLPYPILGDLMRSFHAGQTECWVRGREVEDVAVLDFTQQYPSLFCLLGAERFLTARRIGIRPSTKVVRAWVDSLTRENLFRKETWADPRIWSLCYVAIAGSILPIRSTFGGPDGAAPTIGWNHLTTELGLVLPYMVADVLVAKLLGGGTPRIVRALTFEPVGRQDLQPVELLGVKVGPEDGVVQTLAEARIREKHDKASGWEPRADGLKTINNAGSYGIFVEVNRKLKAGRVRIHGASDEPFEADESEIEEPGSDYFPLIGTALTAASHLLLAMIDHRVDQLGGRVVYKDTDSAFVTPSRISKDVSAPFARLNPYREATDFLKDETGDKAPRTEYPNDSRDSSPRFFGLSSKRYCLFVRGSGGRPYVFRKFASDHGLGSYQVPKDREEWVAELWERIIEKGERASEHYAGIPATSEFSLSTPNLLPRVRDLGDLRPFTFLTARLLEPSPDPEAMRSELVAFIDPKDTSAQAELMSMERQRTWGSVIEDFVRHRDRKYTFDSEGNAHRRHVLVRKRNLVGLGKEANRIEDARVLGLGAVRSRAKRYVDPDPRHGSATEVAKRLGISRRTVFYHRKLRKVQRELKGARRAKNVS